MIAAATGHRPDRLGGYTPRAAALRQRLAREWLEVVRPSSVIGGMAQGWDTDWVIAAHALGIPFTAAVPFVGQERAWPAPARAEFDRLLGLAAEVVIVSPGGFSVRSMHARNHWMVDRSDLLVALWDGCYGGTAECVGYAAKVGRPMVNLWSNWRKLVDASDNNKVSFPQQGVK